MDLWTGLINYTSLYLCYVLFGNLFSEEKFQQNEFCIIQFAKWLIFSITE